MGSGVGVAAGSDVGAAVGPSPTLMLEAPPTACSTLLADRRTRRRSRTLGLGAVIAAGSQSLLPRSCSRRSEGYAAGFLRGRPRRRASSAQK